MRLSTVLKKSNEKPPVRSAITTMSAVTSSIFQAFCATGGNQVAAQTDAGLLHR
jgi:hypothetical protein